MGILDKVARRAADRAVNKAVDRAVNKTVDKVVDKTLDKVIKDETTNRSKEIINKEAEILSKVIMNCSNCGSELSKDDKFCPKCGKEVEKEKIQTLEELEKHKEETLEELDKNEQDLEKDSSNEESVNETSQEDSNVKKDSEKNEEDSKFVKWLKKQNDTKDTTADYKKIEIENFKMFCIFSYLFWLVLIPIFCAKESKYARYHANQGLILTICETIVLVLKIILNAIFAKVGFLLVLFDIIFYIVGAIFLVFMLLGIMNSINGKAKELPIIGKFKILK